MDKPKSLRVRLHEMNRPPEYLQAYPAGDMDEWLDQLQAENARLREALKKIDDAWEAYNRGYSDYSQGYEDALDIVSDIASAALGKED